MASLNTSHFITFESVFEDYMRQLCDENPDPSHDILHVQRVVQLAKKLAQLEKADLNVVVPAAYLHDCVYISKTDSRRKMASQISADKAVELLKEWGYPSQYFTAIHHAVLTHSFSANKKAETIEAQVVQDADRLDAIGAIGLFRCFAFSGLAKRPLYQTDDPFCEKREPQDQKQTLDHFYTKLLGLNSKLNTASALIEGEIRSQVLRRYIEDLKRELL